MRITIVGYFRGDASQNGERIAQALSRQGHNVQTLDFNTPDISNQIIVHQSKIVLVTMGREFDHTLLNPVKDNGAFLVQWIPDEYSPDDEGGKWFYKIKGIYNLLMVETRGIIQFLNGFADDIIWIPQYFDQYYHSFTNKVNNNSKWDLGFLGGPNIAQSSKRVNFIQHLIKDGCDLMIAPGIPWQSTDISPAYMKTPHMLINGDMASFYAHTRIGLNFLNDKLPRYELALSNRAFKTVGCGCFLLTQHVFGIEELLYPGVHCATYNGDDYDDLKWNIDYFLEHPDERVKIAAEGKAHVLKNFNIDKVVAGFIDEIKKRM